MAFYKATGGMWTPFNRVAIGNLIEKGSTIEIAAPYTGTYLIVTSKYAPRVPTGPAVESDVKQVIRYADRGNIQSDVYNFCSYCVIYAVKNQVIYSGLCEQTSTTSIFAPSYCIYYLTGRKLSYTDINYIGCTSSSDYDPSAHSSAYQWGPNISVEVEEDNPSYDWKKWMAYKRDSTIDGNFAGYRFPYSIPMTPPENPLNISDPNKEYIISIIGGVGGAGLNYRGVNTNTVADGYYYSGADGMSVMHVPESNINSTDNTIYNFLSYSDRQASGLVVDFYKFSDVIENLFVSLGTGIYGMGHLLKVTI